MAAGRSVVVICCANTVLPQTELLCRSVAMFNAINAGFCRGHVGSLACLPSVEGAASPACRLARCCCRSRHFSLRRAPLRSLLTSSFTHSTWPNSVNGECTEGERRGILSNSATYARR